MQKENTLEQARLIISAGKMVHDRVNRIISEHLVSCKSCGSNLYDLSVTQLHAIMQIKDNGKLTMTELADKMNISPPSASAMVDRLVEKGLLIREHSTEDRRKVVVDISPNAMENSGDIENTLLAFFVDLMEKLGPETTRQWCAVLTKIKSVIEQE